MIDNTREMETVASLLRDKGITVTLQRLRIAQILLEKPQHLSADQVLSRANNGRAMASKATVYNTLRLLSKKGIVREIFADPAKVFYEPQTTDHHHFFDLDSGEIIDIEPGQVKLKSLPEPPDGSLIDGVDVTIRLRVKQKKRPGF